MADEPALLLLAEVCQELLATARAAKRDAEQSSSDYDKGRQFGLYEAISLLAQQAEVFGIDQASIGLNGIDVDRDLLGS